MSRASTLEEALVARMCQGDRAALGALYDRFAPSLLAIGTRMLSDRRDAEDVLHDVFVEIWASAHSYAPERGSVATWVTVRMRSRCLDRLRSADRAKTLRAEDPHGLAPEIEATPPSSGEVGTVERALDVLPPEQRRVLELGYFHGMSASEIAESVGVSIGTVKSRTAAALSKLRRRLLPTGSVA
ncbi:MAG: sigma-70 family RNA polymerase sigma factor [Myxococcota bacterium]